MAADPKETLWALDPHTAAKHAIVRRYLGAWFPIMSSWNGRILYIDGFSGPGEYTTGEKGSPIIALETAIAHSPNLKGDLTFFFLEIREDRARHLQKIIDSYALPDRVRVLPVEVGRFDEHMTSVLDELDRQNRRLAPTFALIDPFGFSHTPMSVVSRIMGHEGCEVLVTFMYEEINRFLTTPDEKINAHYDNLFGTAEWREGGKLGNSDQRRRFIHDLYVDQLKRVAGVRYVRSFMMINDGNRLDYFLFFGTNSLKGLAKMKDAMWKVDSSGGVGFSDCTNPDQPTLFGDGPNFDVLRTMMLDWAEGQEKTVEEVEKWVLEDTPFASSHYKRNVLRTLEVEGAIEIRSSRKRRYTFPKGTVIRFPRRSSSE